MQDLTQSQLSTSDSTSALLDIIQAKSTIRDLEAYIDERKPEAIQQARAILEAQGRKSGLCAQNDFGKVTLKKVSPTKKDLETDIELSNLTEEIQMEADRLAYVNGAEVRDLHAEIEELTKALWDTPAGKKILGLASKKASLLSSPELRKLESLYQQREEELKKQKKDQIAFELT